jgi:hypothetical protein
MLQEPRLGCAGGAGQIVYTVVEPNVPHPVHFKLTNWRPVDGIGRRVSYTCVRCLSSKGRLPEEQ